MKISRLVIMILVMAMVLGVATSCANTATTASPTTTGSTTTATTAATTAATTTAGEKLKFGFSVAILDNPYFIEVANGFKDACAENGIEAVINDAKYDATEQYNQMENYISMGVDAICVAPVDAKSLEAVVAKAQEGGIRVISEAQGISNADANVIVDDYKYGVANGENVSKWINEKLDGKGKVLILSLDNVEAVILRGNGIQDTIKANCPDAVIVARQMATTIEEAMKVTETVLQANPDVNVIACVNDQLALGAFEAVKNMNIDDVNFFIGGADNTAEMITKMKEAGSLLRSTIDIDPYGTGKKCVEVMLANLKASEGGKNYFFEMIPVWQSDLK